jgi:hypothetical protein
VQSKTLGGNPMMPPRTRRDFEALEASRLFSLVCKRALPVRKRLLLVLLDMELFDCVCAACGSLVGKKEEQLRGTGPRLKI